MPKPESRIKWGLTLISDGYLCYGFNRGFGHGWPMPILRFIVAVWNGIHCQLHGHDDAGILEEDKSSICYKCCAKIPRGQRHKKSIFQYLRHPR